MTFERMFSRSGRFNAWPIGRLLKLPGTAYNRQEIDPNSELFQAVEADQGLLLDSRQASARWRACDVSRMARMAGQMAQATAAHHESIGQIQVMAVSVPRVAHISQSAGPLR